MSGEGGVLGTRLRALYERAVLAGHYRGRALHLQDEALRAFGETGMGLKMRMHPLAAVVALTSAEDLAERVAAPPARPRVRPRVPRAGRSGRRGSAT
ncbi:hypothetical protein EES39_31060 [Streptomyces sp. ADI92-24]|nr:hypothetical protein EES39_31060 [Streptomyces sp. ADI92-24]